MADQLSHLLELRNRPHLNPIKREARAALSLADALFTRTQQRVLALLFGHPARSFYANELIGLAGMGSGAVAKRIKAKEAFTTRVLAQPKIWIAGDDSALAA